MKTFRFNQVKYVKCTDEKPTDILEQSESQSSMGEEESPPPKNIDSNTSLGNVTIAFRYGHSDKQKALRFHADHLAKLRKGASMITNIGSAILSKLPSQLNMKSPSKKEDSDEEQLTEEQKVALKEEKRINKLF